MQFRFLAYCVTLIATLLSVGCAGSSSVVKTGPAMKIEILGFEDCPNTPAFRERVGEAVQMASVQASVVYIDQQSLPENDARRGYPTPTVLVDGRDLFGMPVPTSPAMGCRVYAGGLPDVKEITRRLKESAAQ